MDTVNSWTEFRKKKMQELKQLEENKGKGAKELMPLVAESWKQHKKETAFVENYPEPQEQEAPKETTQTTISDTQDTQEQDTTDYEYQCGKCGYQFNGKKTVCPNCGIKLNESDF